MAGLWLQPNWETPAPGSLSKVREGGKRCNGAEEIAAQNNDLLRQPSDNQKGNLSVYEHAAVQGSPHDMDTSPFSAV